MFNILGGCLLLISSMYMLIKFQTQAANSTLPPAAQQSDSLKVHNAIGVFMPIIITNDPYLPYA